MIADTLEKIKKMARDQALLLRQKSPEMSGTEIIAEEEYVPEWSGEKDYTAVLVGAPVQYNGQIYTLLQPHNAKHYAFAPSELPALWRVAHTTDPEAAKPFVAPTSTSDMYLNDECMLWIDGNVYRCVNANGTAYSPADYSADWKIV